MGIEVHGRCWCGRTCVGTPDDNGNPMCSQCDVTRDAENEKLARASRAQPSGTPTGELHGALACFLYELMRDHLTTGLVEQLMREAVQAAKGTVVGPEVIATNAWLAEYANYIATRLKGKK